jgi:hypothetical protein
MAAPIGRTGYTGLMRWKCEGRVFIGATTGETIVNFKRGGTPCGNEAVWATLAGLRCDNCARGLSGVELEVSEDEEWQKLA